MNWNRWIRPGLVATLLLAAVALFVRGDAVEQDLDARVEARLQSQGLNWATVRAAWRDVVITGTAPSESAQDLAADLARRVVGVRVVSDRTRLLPERSPYAWSARRTGSAVFIEGFVPSEGTRSAMLAEARRVFPAEEIRQELGLARGAPEAFGPAVAFALERLAGLAEGQVMLTDSTLSISGTALSAESLVQAREALAASGPIGMNIGPVEIRPARAPRFVWSAAVSEGGVALAGFIPNNAIRDIVAEQVRAAFPGLAVDDQTVVASGEPEGFLDAVGFAVEALTHLEQGGVTLDELTLDVAGTARDVDSYDSLLDNLGEDLPAEMNVVAADLVPPHVDDYGWRGEVTGEGVVLTGYVPSLADLQEMTEVAETLLAGRGALRNEVHVARGGPVIDWLGGVQFALRQLARLETGSNEISGEAAYSIEGVALTSDDYATTTAEAGGTLPASLTLAELAVEPPEADAYVIEAERDGKTLILSGYVPDRTRHDDLLAFVTRSVPGIVIDDLTAYAHGDPEAFFEAVEVGVRGLGHLTGGRLSVTDNTLELAGFAANLPSAREAAAVLEERLPEDYELASEIAIRQPPQPLGAEACNEALKAMLNSGPLEFDGDDADIALDSRPVLGRLAATLARCPETMVEIGIHSDSDGSQSRNRRRTQARADALLAFMVDADVRRERLAAVGYGESEPIASNETAEGKARNRRIEFALALPEPVGPPELPEPEPPEPEPPVPPSDEDEGPAMPAASAGEAPAEPEGDDDSDVAAPPDAEAAGDGNPDAPAGETGTGNGAN